MVTQTDVVNRAKIFIKAVRVEAEDLPNVEREWDAWEDQERASYFLGWDQVMSTYLREADRGYRAGALPPALREEYRDMLRALQAALPLIERLNSYRPPVSLEP